MKFYNFKNSLEESVDLIIDGDITMDDDFWSMFFGIETVTPKGFISDLKEHQGKNINVWINSYGGDVYAASRIYTALKEHKGQVTVKIDGVAISAASVIAMAGDVIEMSPTSIMMIHNPWTSAGGEAKDMRHAADILDEVKESIINAYQIKSKRSRNKISKMMDEETWMSAKTAIKEGFADKMLYKKVEEDDEEEEKGHLNFSRTIVMNKSSEYMKKFVNEALRRLEEQEIKSNGEVKPAEKATGEKPVNINNLYQKLLLNRRKKEWI